MYAGREYINEKMLQNFSPPPEKNTIKTQNEKLVPIYHIFFRGVTGNKNIIYHGLSEDRNMIILDIITSMMFLFLQT